MGFNSPLAAEAGILWRGLVRKPRILTPRGTLSGAERGTECTQVEGRIRAGPRPDLDAFVAALARLEDSIAFFQQNRCREWAHHRPM